MTISNTLKILLEKKWNIIKCNINKTRMGLEHLNVSLPHEINLKINK